MIAGSKRYAYYYVPLVAVLSLAILTAIPKVADAQETATAVAPSGQGVVKPGDSLWSISRQRLGLRATPQQIADDVALIYELNRDRIGGDPNLIFPGQELSLPTVFQSPTEPVGLPSEPETEPAASVAAEDRQAAERAEQIALPALPEGEDVPEVRPLHSPAGAEVLEEDRQALGLGVIVLTLALAILMTWKLPMRRTVGDASVWGLISRGYYRPDQHDGHGSRRVPDTQEDARGASSATLTADRTPDGSEDGDLKSGHDSDPAGMIDVKAAPLRPVSRPPRRPAEREVPFRGEGPATSAILLPTMAEEEDYYTPPQAGRILKLSRQRITQMLQSGEMEGKQDSETGRWRIPQRVVHGRLKDRPPKRRDRPDEGGAQNDSGGLRRLTELELELRDLSYRLGRSEARLELTEKAESTLQAERNRLLEDLEHERRRAERLEAELREVRRPWWRKLFGG